MIRKAILKGTIFLILTITLIVFVLEPIFVNKLGGHRSKLTQGLYLCEKNSYDVVLIGSSHMNGAIDPGVLWEKYGITSFNYATGGEPFDISYYLLKEVLKKQEKPIVAVDVYYLGLTSPYGSEGYIRYVIDNMRYSINKIDAVIHCTPREEWLYYLVPFLKYHTRWKELSQSDFNYDYNAGEYMKGFSAGGLKYGEETRSNITTKDTSDLPAKSEKYLNKLIELSKQKGFDLILINAPHDYASTTGIPNWHKQVAKMYNRVAEIAEKNNIPFIDYNKMFDEIDFDFSDDMNNEGHVNIWGSEKITTHFGEFLKNNYKVADHKNDGKYASWDADLKLYYREIAAQKLIAQDSINSYFDMLKNENYIIAISSSENSNVGKKLMEDLKQAGLQFDKGRKDDKYIAVLDSNNKVLEKWGDSGLSGEIALGDNKKLKIASSEDISGGTSILLDGVDYSIKGDGLNMVVYDKALGNIVDSIYIDSNNIITRSK